MSDQASPFQRALLVLRMLAEARSQSIGVRELAARAAMSPASAHRVLGTLLGAGLATRDNASGRYRLGVEAFRLGLLLSSNAPWRELCLPHIRMLAEATGETTAFAILDRARLQMQTVAKLPSRHAVTVTITDEWKPLHAGASGLAILAFLPPDEQSEALQMGRLRRETPETLVSPEKIRKELQTAAQRGYALTRGQRIVGAVGLGAPVFLPGGEVLGSVYLSIPEQRFTRSSERRIADAILLAANAFSTSLRSAPA